MVATTEQEIVSFLLSSVVAHGVDITSLRSHVEDLRLRVEGLEYVYPRLSQKGEIAPAIARESILVKLTELREAIKENDEVEIFGISASVRQDLKAQRDFPKIGRLRKFALGYIYDALSFTAPSSLEDRNVDSLVLALSIALETREPTANDLDSIRSVLESDGFELFPTSSDGG